MKLNNTFKFILLISLNFFLIFSTRAQTKVKYKRYTQRDFEKNKILENTFHLWWSKDSWGPIVRDTIPYFVDDRNYKGIINYGVEFKSKDFRTFIFNENKIMYFIKVDFENCKFSTKDSVIEIEGFVSGGWGDKEKIGLNEPKNYISVFIGEKTDTISACYLNIPVNKDKIDITLNNKFFDKNQIVENFPSFYFKKYKCFRTTSKGKRFFKIEGKINKNTIIAFGGSSCYSEIFDIGSMIYLPNKNEKVRINKNPFKESETIIFNNKLVSEIEKEKAQKLEVNYYNCTEKAEQFILRRQYAKAKEEYKFLIQNYPTQFARDIHNAIRCAVLSRDYKSAFLWSEKLANKGVEISYFNSKVFANLKKSPEWIPFKTKYDSLCKISVGKTDKNLRQQILQLLDEDQSDYALENRKEPKILYETTQKITSKFVELLKKEGFPSEEKIGVFIKNDTTLVSSPDYNVIIRHAVQQYPDKLNELLELLDKASASFDYDKERSGNHKNFPNACFHIYKGNLYIDKSCGSNDLEVRKITFKFNNTYNFIMDYGDYIITEYNKENPKSYDDFYKENFNFIMKLTDDWEFYEK